MSPVLIDSITALCAADHADDPEAIGAWTQNKSVEGVTAMLANPSLRMFVAEWHGTVCAVGAVSDAGEVALNYVAPEARLNGISKVMLRRLESELVAMGHAQARLEATATALRFYRAAGWTEAGPQTQGRKVNGFPMRKTLA